MTTRREVPAQPVARTRVDEMMEVLKNFNDRDEVMTADDLVVAAKDRRKYPLLWEHLWAPSNTELAQEARTQRAYRLIIMHYRRIPAGPPVRMILNVVREDEGDRGYMHRDLVQRSVDLSEQYLDKLRDDLLRAIKRYQNTAAFLDPDVREQLGEAMRQAWRVTFKPGTARPFPGDEEERATA